MTNNWWKNNVSWKKLTYWQDWKMPIKENEWITDIKMMKHFWINNNDKMNKLTKRKIKLMTIHLNNFYDIMTMTLKMTDIMIEW